MTDTRTPLQRQSDELFIKMHDGWTRVVLAAPIGSVPAGTIFWTLPKEKDFRG